MYNYNCISWQTSQNVTVPTDEFCEILHILYRIGVQFTDCHFELSQLCEILQSFIIFGVQSGIFQPSLSPYLPADLVLPTRAAVAGVRER